MIIILYNMKIIKKNNVYFLNPKDVMEKNIIDNYIFKDLKITDLDNNCINISKVDVSDLKINNNNKDFKSEIKIKIIKLLNDDNFDIKNKIEGNFEKFLKSEDQDIFKDMLNKKEVILFKLSTKYKNSIYKSNVDISLFYNGNITTNTNSIDCKKESSVNKSVISNDNINNFIDFYEKNKFVILKNSTVAEKFSKKYYSELKDNRIVGIKGFDNSYYIISKELYFGIKNKILILQKDFEHFTILELNEHLKVNADILKIVLEVLKEECLVIEKNKSNYYFV